MGQEFYINIPRTKNNIAEFKQMQKSVLNSVEQLQSIKGNLAGASYGAVIASLDAIIQNNSKYADSLMQMGDVLADIVAAYEKAEKKITGVDLDSLKIDDELREKLREFIDRMMENLLKMLKGKNKCNTFGGDPINFATGNFLYQRNYLKLKGLFPIELKLSYNSVAKSEGVLGRGWVHNYEIYLEQRDNQYILHRADGGEDTFLYENGEYRHFVDENCVLIQTSDGWESVTPFGITYAFNKEGICTKLKDRNENEVVFDYDDKKRLIEVRSISGEALYYTYNEEGFVEEVSDSENRSVRLSYENGYLIKVEDEEMHTFQYSYDENGNVSKVVNGRNIQTLENEYDAKGRVIKQSYPDGGFMELEYDDVSRVLHVTEQNGNKVDHIHDERMRSVETVYSDGKIQYGYNDRNQKTFVIDKKGNKTQYKYDEAGNLNMVENPLGETMEMEYNSLKQIKNIKICGEKFQENEYDENGNLTVRRDALGREIVLRYNRNGKPEEIVQPDGSSIKLTYDKKGNITAIEEPCGGKKTYEYDGLGQVTATTDANGNRTEYEYNKKGYITKVTNAIGNTKRFTYNESSLVTCIEDFNGSRVYREYNEINKISKMTNQEGSVITLEYDEMYNVKCRTEANGAKTHFVYDKFNRLERMINPKGAWMSYEYDANGNRTQIMDSDGGVVKLEYDALNRLVKIEDADGSIGYMEYNRFGQRTKMTDAKGNVRQVIYNEAGQKIKSVDVKGNETKYSYNALGKISEVIDPEGRKTSYSYLPGGLLQKVTYPDGSFVSYTYDANHNIKSRQNQDGYTLFYTYDVMNRIVQVESSEGQKKQYTYDTIGNVETITDANGNTTRYSYTPVGKLEAVTDPLGNRTQYVYDKMGGLTDVYQYEAKELKEACRINEENAKTPFMHYERNLLGQVEKVTDAAGYTEHYFYNNNGKLIEKIDKEGLSTKYDYTYGGQLAEIKYADGNSVKLAYNELKQLTEIKDWLGTTTIEVDELGRAEKVTDYAGNEVSYQRGKQGQKLSMQYPNGKQVKYGYDDLMRLTSLQNEDGIIQYQYDGSGNLVEKLFPNGTKINYSYNAKGLLTSFCSSDNEGVIDLFEYQYDAVGNKVQVNKQRRDLANENGVYRYEYDALNRLTGVQKDDEFLRKYDYDAWGNRVLLESKESRTDYYYNERNQLIRSVSGEDVTDYSYDARGNLIKVMDNGIFKNGYEYDSTNRLVRAMNETGQASVYGYNGLLQRVSRQNYEKGSAQYVDGVIQVAENENPIKTVEYVLDQMKGYHNLLMQKEDDQTYEYIWDGNVAMEKGNEGAHYFLQDELGSPLRYMNQDGSIAQSYAFDEFGNDLLPEQNKEQDFGCAGYRKDIITGTYFVQEREYLPSTGRFVARDRIKGFKSAPYTLNEYSYCWNRPLSFVDRDGAFPTYAQIKDTIIDTGEAVGDWLGDKVNSVGEEISGGVTSLMEGSKYVWDNYVSPISKLKTYVNGKVTLGLARVATEINILPFVDTSDIMAWASQQWWGEAFLDSVNFERDEDGVYHTDPNCWQAPFGYNDFYDYVFDGFTSMDKKEVPFTVDGTEYIIWMWKGDYFNLGAGCETGIYYGKEGDFHYNSATDTNLKMSISLYDKNTNEKILDYNPTDPQWWITGFNPEYQDRNESDLEVRGCIDFSENEKLWNAFYGKYKMKDGWCFDEENKKAYYKW